MDGSPVPDISLKKYDKVVMGILTAGVILLAGGAAWGLYVIMPMLVELAKNTVIFFALLAAAIFLMLLAGQAWMMRKTIIFKMKMVARNMRKAIIKSDPIGAIDVAIQNLEARYEQAGEQSKNAEAATETLKKKISNPKRDGAIDMAENEERLSRIAMEKGLPEAQINLHLVAAERWRRTAESLQPIYERQVARQRKINEARELCASGLANLRNQKQTLQVQLDAYQAEAAQSRAYRSFFGSNEDLETIDMAVEEIERQSSECEAEVVQMLRQAEPGLERERLQRESDAASARARIDAAREKGALPPAIPVKDAEVVKNVH